MRQAENAVLGAASSPRFLPEICAEGAAQLEAMRLVARILLDVTAGVDMSTEDLHTLSGELAAKLGHAHSMREVERAISWCARLHTELPTFRPLFKTRGLVSWRHMISMERVFERLEEPLTPQQCGTIDAALVEKFTATVPGQDVPSPGEVSRWLEEMVREMLLPTETADTKPNTVALSSGANGGNALLTAELSDMDAKVVFDTIEAFAKQHEVSKSEALVTLVCNRPEGTDVVSKLVLVGFGSPRPEETVDATWLYNTGPVTAAQRAKLCSVRKVYYDAHQVAKQCRREHEPSFELRATIWLRDLTCRYPGCNVPAHKCDMDHVINHAAGGWTTASNLQSLCRKHHNAKTDRRVRATMNTKGHVTWHRANGAFIGTTLPKGPLAGLEGLIGGITTRHSGKTEKDDNTNPPIRNGLGRWGYTLEQKRRRIRRFIKLRAQGADPPPAGTCLPHPAGRG